MTHSLLRCSLAAGLAVWLGLGLVAVPDGRAFDLSSPVQQVLVSLDGETVSYSITDPITGQVKGGSVTTPGIVSVPSVSGGVVAWVAGQTVYFTIYDLTRGAWMGYYVSSAGASVVSDPRNSHGVVAWNADQLVYFAVYDPARGAWMIGSKSSGGFVYDVRCFEGVVAWVAGDTTVYYRTYDPVAGAWAGGNGASPGAPAINDLLLADGVATWSANGVVYCRVFDHTLSSWRTTNVVATAYISDLTITNGTVTWKSGTVNDARGYHPDTGLWTNAAAKVRANFFAAPSAGNAPLTVWFWDLSLGATLRSWSFSDGGSSFDRTPFHVFSSFLRNTVTLTASRLGSSHSTNWVVLSDTNPPTGSILINDGSAYTPFTNVTLALSAADNSGTTMRMRFSNQNTESWSAWEPYAPTKLWTVTSGDGLKTVYASFKDEAGNISTTVSDSIGLYTRKPTVAFATNNFVGTESNRSVTITVVLSASTVFTSAVSYATADGQATAPADYTSTSGRLTFLPGELSKSFNVSLVNDDLPENNETFQIILSDATNIVVGAVGTATIMDNDPPFVSFASAAYSVGEDLGQAVVNAVLSTASGRTVTVQYATQNGTALAGMDYAGVTNRLTFVPGQTNSSFVVPILNDSLDEPDKTLLLSLSLPTNGVLGSLTNAVLNLIDDDPPTAYFGASTFFVAEPEGFIDIPVFLSSTYTQVVSVGYRTFNGSASVGSDYIAASGTLIYFPGQTNQSFPVTLLPDSLAESMESVILVLTNFVGATPGTPSQATLNILDNASTSVLWAPTRLQSNTFQFTVIAATGNQYAVEASTNLTNWAELSRFTQTNRMTGFQDTNTAGFLKRFYRARKVN